MGGLCEERFGGSGMGVENENEGWGRMETVGGDSNEMGSVTKKKEEKSTTGIGTNLTPDYKDKE